MEPTQWATNTPSHAPNDRELIQHGAECFAYLIADRRRMGPGEIAMREFSAIIRQHYDQHEPRTAAVLAAMDRSPNAVLTWKGHA